MPLLPRNEQYKNFLDATQAIAVSLIRALVTAMTFDIFLLEVMTALISFPFYNENQDEMAARQEVSVSA